MLHRTPHAAAILAAFGFCLFAMGCGSNDGRPPLARVSGTVTYKGKPLPGASLAFLPEQPGIRSAISVTDDQGRYKLWTYDAGDGAPVGSHQVTVALRGPPEKTALHPSAKGKNLGEAYYEQVAATGK